MLLPRILVSLSGGALVAVGLLWLMQWLVAVDSRVGQQPASRPVMEFVRLKRDSRPELRRRELPEPEPLPEQAPPPPPMPTLAAAAPVIDSPAIDMTIPSVPLTLDGPYLGPMRSGPPDRDFVALSRLPPRYPYRAQRLGIEGWVRVSFLITEQGEVRDVVVLDADPKDTFDQAALRAVAKWRFKPRIQDGQPVAVRAEQLVQFRLEGGKR